MLPRLSLEIAGRREARGLTQMDLAEMLEVDAASVHRWERGQARPRRPAVIRALMAELGFSQAELDRLYVDWIGGRMLEPGRFRVEGCAYLQRVGMDEYDLLDRLLEIDTQMIPGLAMADCGDAEQWVPLFHALPDCWRLVTCDDRVAGYWQYLVVDDACSRLIGEGRLRDSQFVLEHLVSPLPITGAETYHGYLVAIGMDQAYANPTSEMLLLRSLMTHFGDLARQGVFFATIHTRAFTHFGADLARRLGFAPVPGCVEGPGRLFRMEGRDIARSPEMAFGPKVHAAYRERFA